MRVGVQFTVTPTTVYRFQAGVRFTATPPCPGTQFKTGVRFTATAPCPLVQFKVGVQFQVIVPPVSLDCLTASAGLVPGGGNMVGVW